MLISPDSGANLVSFMLVVLISLYCLGLPAASLGKQLIDFDQLGLLFLSYTNHMAKQDHKLALS